MFGQFLHNSKSACGIVTFHQTATSRFVKSHFQSCRGLSVSETAVALRPFIFTVHPDLFGQFPRERAVNEESLKKLNEYIDQLHGKRQVHPLTLTFYVRSPTTPSTAHGNFKSVHIPLAARGVHEAVKVVLSSCNLPLDYIDSIATDRARPRFAVSHNIRSKSTDKTTGNNEFSQMVNSEILFRFYSAYSNDQSHIRRHPIARDSVCDWLRKNVDRARAKGCQMGPIRVEIGKLKELITEETGAVDVQWQSNWGLSSFRTALRGLLRVCRQHSDIVNLKGRTVVFGCDTGVCVQGHVILRHDDVADNWIVTLRSLYQHDAVLCKIPAAKQHLSTLLGNAEITRQPHQPVTMAGDYLCQLRKLSDSVLAEQARVGGPKINQSLDGVQLVIDCAIGPLMVSQFGQILIPSSTPAFLVIDFINSHAAEAKHIRQEYLKSEKSHVETIQRCYAALNVDMLIRDPDVTRAQMESCCKRLLELSESGRLNVDLTLCRLRVAQFFSVMSDGDICIPWNFEDVI